MNGPLTLRRLPISLLIAVAALLPLSSLAQTLNTACKADAKTHCAGTPPGGGRVLACLQAHEAELQPACKAQLPALQQCSAEVKRLCGDLGPRKLKACMKTNAEKLGASCKADTGAD